MKNIIYYLLLSILASCGRRNDSSIVNDSSSVKRMDTSGSRMPNINPDTFGSNMPVLKDTSKTIPK
jgi:hypothetical protein